jgi:hypothetical protein
MSINSGTTGGRIILVVMALGAVGGGAIWLSRPGANAATRGGMVYSAAGFGGYVPGAKATDAVGGRQEAAQSPTTRTRTSTNNSTNGQEMESGIIRAAVDYQLGRYADAEAEAKQVSASVSPIQNPKFKIENYQARADLIVAYSEARLHNLQSAREWFWKVRDEASKLSDHGARKQQLGESRPTIEEEAAYQHAVCTGALGEQNQAEVEYKKIMKEYPESPLVHGSVKRIARFHGGNVPPDAEAVWKRAMTEARRREDAREAKVSRCGPECLAEVLQRRDAETRGHGDAETSTTTRTSSIEALAREMGTDKDGTSIASIVVAAKKRGIPARGLMLTQKGLARQKLPLMAILAPGHYVLVQAVNPTSVTIWDPYLNGPGKPEKRAMKLDDWKKQWGGVAVALR